VSKGSGRGNDYLTDNSNEVVNAGDTDGTSHAGEIKPKEVIVVIDPGMEEKTGEPTVALCMKGYKS